MVDQSSGSGRCGLPVFIQEEICKTVTAGGSKHRRPRGGYECQHSRIDGWPGFFPGRPPDTSSGRPVAMHRPARAGHASLLPSPGIPGEGDRRRHQSWSPTCGVKSSRQTPVSTLGREAPAHALPAASPQALAPTVRIMLRPDAHRRVAQRPDLDDRPQEAPVVRLEGNDTPACRSACACRSTIGVRTGAASAAPPGTGGVEDPPRRDRIAAATSEAVRTSSNSC